MKALLLTLILTTVAQGRSLHPDTFAFTAKLKNMMNIHEDSQLSGKNLFLGKISVNKVTNNIRLSFDYAPSCDEGYLCATVLQKIIIELPIVNEKVTECNNKVYTAMRDLRAVDGAFEELVVSDNSNNSCPTFAPYAPTDISYTEKYFHFNGESSEAFSQFEAEKLKNGDSPSFK